MQTKNREKKEDEGEESNPESEQDFVKNNKKINSWENTETFQKNVICRNWMEEYEYWEKGKVPIA
jgi:hypothetical protein